MPFIPHTTAETQVMLATLGFESLDDLFAEIPGELLLDEPIALPSGLEQALGEHGLLELMQVRAGQDRPLCCFAGAGAYEHAIPQVVGQLLGRGELYSPYTPYQAEASQGSLQIMFEFQSMMAELLAVDVVNASVYDGASALAEAILMALRCHKKGLHRVLVAEGVHPVYRQVAATITSRLGVEIITLPRDKSGRMDEAAWRALQATEVAAVVIAQPNFYGVLEEPDALVDWAQAGGALAIAVVNPLCAAVLRPPGQWGRRGVDIVCGEAQGLGLPLSGGGPYLGFLGCKMAHVRQLPGRLVGESRDRQGRRAFTLTLQAREQHIRRARATSNICTNQGLCVVASAMTMALLGPQGLASKAATCHARTRELAERLVRISGVRRVFSAPFFHEVVLDLGVVAEPVWQRLADHGFLAGYPLGRWDKTLEQCLLLCATEARSSAEIEGLAGAMSKVLGR